MRKYLLFIFIVFLFSCEKDDKDNVNTAGSTYKVVIEQSGDYGNYNKSLIAMNPDDNGQAMKFKSSESALVKDAFLKSEDLTAAKITLVSVNPSPEIDLNFIVNPIPVDPATAGPMAIKFIFYKGEKSIGEKNLSFVDDFVVKEERLKFK